MDKNFPIVTPLNPVVGAEISHVDLSKEMEQAAWRKIKQAFDLHSVLVFRDQHITIDEQKKFAKNFGDLFIQEHLLPLTLEGHPECMALHNNDKKPPGLNYWHTDNSGWEKPPLGTMLYAKITPQCGGDTLFSSMYMAYATLSKFMQEFLKPLKAVHNVQKAFGSEYDNLQSMLKKYGLDPSTHFENFKPMHHPIIRTHPETNKLALYISEPYVTHIEGLKKRESEILLSFLYEHIKTQEFIYRHRWKTNDLLIWDNRCTQHYAVADYFPEERLMYRLNICGEIPFFKDVYKNKREMSSLQENVYAN